MCDCLQIPLHSVQQPVPVGEGVMCVQILDCQWHPFHLLVATKTHLMLVDMRQPAEPLFKVSHHLLHPPVAVTSLQLQNQTSKGGMHGPWVGGEHLNSLPACLVLVSSGYDNVVFYCNSIPSCPVLSTVGPHTVCSLRCVF